MGCNACAEQLFPEMQECASVQTCCEGILLDWHSYYTNLLMENLHVLYICFFCGGKFRLSVCRSMNSLFDAALCRSLHPPTTQPFLLPNRNIVFALHKIIHRLA